MNGIPNIHLFETSESFYMLDVNTDQILSIPENVYNELKYDKNSEGSIEETHIYIKKLKQSGYMKTDTVQISEHPMTMYLPYMLRHKLTQVILQVTQNCNLRCEYCIYSGEYKQREHSQKTMNWDIAKKGIDYLISHSRDSDIVSLAFYGGEPFLNFELIKKCTEYFIQVVQGKEYRINITTNGTLLNDEINKYLVHNKVRLAFSLDGPEEIHDKHRKYAYTGNGSFKTLIENVKKLRSNYPEYYKRYVRFNSVIDIENGFNCLNEYVSNDEIFNDKLFNATIITTDYSMKQRETSYEFTSERNYEYFKVMLAKAGKLDKKHISKLLFSEFEELGRERIDNLDHRTKFPEKGHHSGPCIPGAKRLFINAEGYLYPCERVSENSEVAKIGHIDNGVDLVKAEQILNVERYSSDLCKICWAYKYCLVCIKQMDALSEVSLELLKKRCINIRKTIENRLKDYCVMKEIGYNFYNEKSI